MKKTILILSAAALLFGACCNKQETATADNAAEVVMQNILSRKSVRSYNGDTIPAAVMDNLLKAAMAAPSGRDLRPWQVVVMTDKSQYETVFEGNFNMQKFMESGAVLILCADTTFTAPTREDPDGPAVTQVNQLWRDDMGAVTENLLLAVEAYNLGACWTACYPYADRMDPIKKALQLPPTVVPYAVVPIGYPSTENSPKDKWDPARVHYNRW
ncbi:MAG: nitroreductase family protein [Bacteroidales bacterium]|nr:nitroreductase family protein [Bacteroidales bacterium]